jgi:NADH-quinone oxidoreductase subunit M
VQKVAFNALSKPANRSIPDLNARELTVLLPLVALILWLGFYPRPFLDRMAPSATGVLQAAAQVRLAPDAPFHGVSGVVERGVTMAGAR